MPSYSRKNIIRSDEVSTYHLVTRCVRRTFLCGKDFETGRNFEHRKDWIVKRLNFVLEKVFCIDLIAYTVMSNHVHFVATIRPDLAEILTDEEVIQRWWNLYPRKINGEYLSSPPPVLKQSFLMDKKWIQERRKRLSSLSWFMASIAEYIARKANKEDEVTGRFWEGRFKSQLLLDDKAVLAAATYVDLNPIRAKSAISLEESNFTSIQQRILELKTRSNDVYNKDFQSEFIRCYIFIKLKTPSLALDPSDYVGICTWKAAEILGKSSKDKENIFNLALKKIIPVVDHLDIDIVRRSKFAIGPRDKVVAFAKHRGVAHPHHA